MLSLVIIFSAIFFTIECSEDCYLSEKTFHRLSSLDVEDIIRFDESLKTNSNLKKIFNKINLIRPVGSYNHEVVRRFIREYLLLMGWNVEETPFTTETLIGTRKFVNIIGTQNVSKSRRLVLACHYDSLRMDDFVGSTDSALSCAMIISVAEILTPLLNKRTDLDISLELVFFDGEEAFVKWSSSDSLYGSRYLVKVWSNKQDNYRCSRLDAIDSLILLDLIGASKPRLYFFNGGNYRLFKSLSNIERKIEREEDIFRDVHHPYFHVYSVSDAVIQDDHVPFMERGVPVVHLIPVPFPSQWHSTSDNAQAINWKSSKDLELILSVFLIQYFHLEDHLSELERDED